MLLNGDHYSARSWSEEKKLVYSMARHEELSNLYQLVSKLACVCLRKEIRLIIENPRGALHYLNRYWPLKPAVIDMDRRENGDYYRKPTQYWFINCSPENFLLFEPVENVEDYGPIERAKGTRHGRAVMRSMISPEYARRFIRQKIIGA